MLNNYLWFGTGNTKIGFTEKDRKFVRETSAGLEEAIECLSEYFHLEKSFSPIRAILVPDRKEFDRLVKELLKVDIEEPSRPSRIAQPQCTDLVLLAPSAYSTDSTYEYSGNEYKRLIFHETTHIFEEYLSPNIEALPRWWSEGLAAYLSGQWKHDEDQFIRQLVLKGIKEKLIPDMKEIQVNTKLCYDWGWTVVMFIENTYGKEMILKIVRECDNGDVFGILCEDFKNFEKRWKKWLLENGKSSINFT